MENIAEFLAPLTDRVAEFLPKLGLALAILLAGLLAASLLRAVTRRIIANVSEFAKKRFQMLPGPLARAPWALFGAIPHILYAFVCILTAALVAEALELALLTTWLSGIMNFLPQVIAAALLIVAGFVGGGWLRGVAENAMANSRITHRRAIGIAIQYATAVVSAIVGVDLLGIDVSFVTTTFYIVLAVCLASMGIAFGLGARTMVANIIACYLLGPEFKPGVRVRVDQHEGSIVRISGAYVHLETPEGLINLPGAYFADRVSVLVSERGETA